MFCRSFLGRFSSPALQHLRNIGISAHVDSGKTTLTERLLYYTGKISEIHEIQGKDGVGCKMDHMELERERGITITSAATTVQWNNPEGITHHFNVIDTPGHIDFTIEVERSLRVLDGAVMLLCGVSGVQSQTVTVDRQMRRYNVPRIIFVNKLDRRGSDVFTVMEHLKQKLSLCFAPLQIPIGQDNDFKGVVDLVTMRAELFTGEKGSERVQSDIPADLKAKAEEYRERLLEKISDLDDTIAEKIINGDAVSVQDLKAAIRRATLSLKFCPLLMGSAYRNKAVQPLLDAVCDYLPSPLDRSVTALDLSNDEKETKIYADINKPFVGFAFKVQDLPGSGNVTYVRVYQGKVKKGDQLIDTRTDGKVAPKRVLRMNANEVREIPFGGPGDIVGLGGVDVDSGTTITDGMLPYVMTSMHVPEPVMSLSLKMSVKADGVKFSKALNRFQKEDPTFKVAHDDESKETIISGMGELHLEIYAERMRREYGLPVETGPPTVNYRETLTSRSEFNFTFKKQNGGRGLFARLIGYIEPTPEDQIDPSKPVRFVNSLSGNNIPPNYVGSIQKGFLDAAKEGLLTGHPCINMQIVLTDGMSHEVDSNDLAFRLAAKGALHQAYVNAGPVVLEPIMKVQVVGPRASKAGMLGTITGRRGSIISNAAEGLDNQVIEASVPLRAMFGYTNDLRGATQGHGEYSMEFLEYQAMPSKVQEELEGKYKDKTKKRLDD